MQSEIDRAIRRAAMKKQKLLPLRSGKSMQEMERIEQYINQCKREVVVIAGRRQVRDPRAKTLFGAKLIQLNEMDRYYPGLVLIVDRERWENLQRRKDK